MQRLLLLLSLAAVPLVTASCSVGAAAPDPYKVVRTARVGGPGGYDYVYADVEARRLYVPRRDPATPQIAVYDLDTLAPVGAIANASARGVAIDPRSHHGFASSKPVVMWDTATLATIRTIDVEGSPDGMLFDPFNGRVYVLSHQAPDVTVLNGSDGAVIGTIALGGRPEQAVTDGKGRLYVALEDTSQIAVVDAATMKVIAHWTLGEGGHAPAGLAFDVKNRILFAACTEPARFVILSAVDGRILTTLPIGAGTDGALFNPATMEAFSSNRDGTLTVVKESSPTSFAVEQVVPTRSGAKTLTLDTKTNRLFLITAARPIADTFTILVVGR
jgi:DNA-binding beta-propeller fold protein YncE